MPVFAYPPDQAGRIADHQSIRRNIFGHYGSCTDHGIFADRMAANDRRIRADRGSSADMRLQILVFT